MSGLPSTLSVRVTLPGGVVVEGNDPAAVADVVRSLTGGPGAVPGPPPPGEPGALLPPRPGRSRKAPIFGFDSDGRPIAEEQETIRRILSLRRVTGWATRKIADCLNAEGRRAARPGTRWAHGTVQRVLDRAAGKAAPVRAKATRPEVPRVRACGSPPFGYTRTGGRDEAEQETIRLALKLRDEEGLNIARVAERLNAAGRTTRKGTPWRHASVWWLLGRLDRAAQGQEPASASAPSPSSG